PDKETIVASAAGSDVLKSPPELRFSENALARWRPAPWRKLCRPNLSASLAATRSLLQSSALGTDWPRSSCNWYVQSPCHSAAPCFDSRCHLVDSRPPRTATVVSASCWSPRSADCPWVSCPPPAPPRLYK